MRDGRSLGSDSYGLPGYFGPQRWTYYRLNTNGHSALLVSNASQSPTATANITVFNVSDGSGPSSPPLNAWGLISHTDAYPGTDGLTAYERGIAAASNVTLVVVRVVWRGGL